MKFRYVLETRWAPRKSAEAVLVLAMELAASTTARAQTPGTWSTTGSLKNARWGDTATLLSNSHVLVAGGFDGPSNLASAELNDLASAHWTVTGSMNTARDGHTATLRPNGQVLVAGGFNTSPNGCFMDCHGQHEHWPRGPSRRHCFQTAKSW